MERICSSRCVVLYVQLIHKYLENFFYGELVKIWQKKVCSLRSSSLCFKFKQIIFLANKKNSNVTTRPLIDNTTKKTKNE